jgi:endonuclease YncB( thermonuclease family)
MSLGRTNVERRARIIAAVLAGAFLLAPAAAFAADVTGRAKVIDGDSIEIDGRQIRLFGIDAPEGKQSCERDGRTYRCGQEAALALANKIGAEIVTCEQRDLDRYQRFVAVCRLGSLDLNGWMVSQGLAIAYRKHSLDYIAEEAAAKAARRGLWAGTMVAPSEFRQEAAGQSAAASQQADRQDCRIKGNISASGERIYHVPGGAFYKRTRVDPAYGERWFCTEDEAIAAGWRRSRR